MKPPRCPNCNLRLNLCYCGTVTPIAIKTKLSVVMHVGDRERVSNTVRLLSLIVPSTEIFLVGKKDDVFKGLPPPDPEKPRYLLYPDYSAKVLDENFCNAHPQGVELVIADGTWTQAKRLSHRNSSLMYLPRVKVATAGPSAYRLRRGSRPEGLCTIEAVAYALGVLENQAVEEKLLTHFDDFVKRVLWGREREAPYIQPND